MRKMMRGWMNTGSRFRDSFGGTKLRSLGAFASIAIVSGCSVSEHDVIASDDAAGDRSAPDSGLVAGRDATGAEDGSELSDASRDTDAAERRDAGANRDAFGNDASDPNDGRGLDALLDTNGRPDSSFDVLGDGGSSDSPVVDGPVPDRDAATDPPADRAPDTSADSGLDAIVDGSLDAIPDANADGSNDAQYPDGDAPIVSADDLWAVGNAGVILHWTKSSGWTFETTPPTGNAPFYDIWGTSRSNVWAVGDGAIFHYDGSSWTSTPNPVAQARMRAVWGSASSDVWAVGYDTARSRGLILRYNGSSWAETSYASIFDGQSLGAIWGNGPRDIWLAGNGKIFHFGATANWDEVVLPDGGVIDIEAIWTPSSTSGWMLGAGGEVLQLSAGGWSRVAVYPETWFQSVTGSSASDVWAIAWTGPLLTENKLFRNTGSGWVDGPAATLPLMNDIFARSSQDVWFVGWTGVIAHYDGSTVTPDATVPTQETLQAIWGPK